MTYANKSARELLAEEKAKAKKPEPKKETPKSKE